MPKNRKTRAEIEEEVKVKVEAEKKAHFLVEHLVLEEKVSELELEKVLNFIMVNHYQDVTEERSISQVCGYPLCGNKLQKMKKQRYHISLSQKKVFDNLERQFFCSDFCFKASKHIEGQISTAPLWLRSEPQVIKFLQKGENIQTSKIECDDVLVSCEKNLYSRYDEFECDEFKNIKKENRNEHLEVYHAKQTKILEGKDEQMITSLNKLQTTLLQWFDGYKSDTDNPSTFKSQKVKVNSSTHKNADFQMKAMNFLSKNPDWAEEAEFSKDFKQKMNVKDDEGKKGSHMPPIDSKSQILLRKNIVKERIISSLNKLQPIIGWNGSDFVRWGLFSYLEKLNYTRENIVLKPKEWIITTICLMKIHSLSYEDLQQCLDENREELDKFLKNDENASVQQIECICDLVSRKLMVKDDNKDTDDNSEDSDDDFFDGIFRSPSGVGDLSTIAEYGEFEELD